MSITLDQVKASPADAREIDRLADNLIRSLDLARSIEMPMLVNLLEMSLIELGQSVANQQKCERDHGLS